MDTSRRRSHRTVNEARVEQLEALIIDILREYRADIYVHGCESCMVNVEIFEQKVRALGVEPFKEPALDA